MAGKYDQKNVQLNNFDHKKAIYHTNIILVATYIENIYKA